MSFAFMNFLYLRNNRENLTLEEVVALQTIDSDILYGTAIYQNTIAYKLELLEKKRPKIITFGQSRVMQFRGYFFSQPFLNLGGAWPNICLAKKVAEDIVKINKPEVVIISIDYWLFDSSPEYLGGDYNRENNRLAGIIKPWLWIFEKKISFSDYFKDLLYYDEYTEYIGVNGRYNKVGFGVDGSYYYNALVSGLSNDADLEFHSTLHAINSKDWLFKPFSQMSAEKFGYFLDILNFFSSQGVKVVLFMPPLAPTPYTHLKQKISNYPYYQQVLHAFQKQDLFFADFHDPETLESTNCEYLDGLHPGDTVYARILLKLANIPQYKFLNSYINVELLEEISRNYRDISFIPQKENSPKEVDFLGIGCEKPRHIPLAQLITQKT